MKQDYQVTLYCSTGAYRPVSCLVSIEQVAGVDLTRDATKRAEIKLTGIKKICCQKYWTKNDLKKYSYNQVKIRLYDREKVQQEQKERYEQIKQQKYATGEWKEPKNKIKKV